MVEARLINYDNIRVITEKYTPKYSEYDSTIYSWLSESSTSSSIL